MDLRQLRYFIALAEHRSFVRAADAMGITQPAFSRSIQGLEQGLAASWWTVAAGPAPDAGRPGGAATRAEPGAGSANLIHEIAQLNKLDAGELRFGSGRRRPSNWCRTRWPTSSTATRGCRSAWTWTTGEKLSRALLREEIEFFVADIRDFEADPNFQTRPLTRAAGSSAVRNIRCWARTACPPTTCSTTRWPRP